MRRSRGVRAVGPWHPGIDCDAMRTWTMERAARVVCGAFAWLLAATAFAQDVPAPRPTPLRQLCPRLAESFGDTRYPRAAIAAGLDRGDAVIAFTVDGDTIVDSKVVSASHPVFADAAMAVVASLKCHSDRPVRAQIPIAWKRE